MQSKCNYQGKQPLTEDKWREYIENCVVPIYVNLKTLDDFGNYLIQEVQKHPKLGEINQELLPYFLGGINEKGLYVENSLAKLIKDLYGVGVDPVQLRNLYEIGHDYRQALINNWIMSKTPIHLIRSLAIDLE